MTLRWIQERYEAEVVTLTVNLGQPDEDREVVTAKARGLGALDAIVVDARSSPYALSDRALAGFGESGGGFSQTACPRFIELFTLQSRMAHRLRNRVEGEGMTSLLYELIGRVVVAALRFRYRNQLRIAAGVGIAGVALAGLLAARRVPPEG